VASLADMVAALPSPKVVWVMVPQVTRPTDTINELAGLLSAGDLVVDGGNSKWTDDAINADPLPVRGLASSTAVSPVGSGVCRTATH